MTAAPRVSVVIPAFNSKATIGATLASVAAQTYKASEVLVVDDGSTDGTREMVAAMAGAPGYEGLRLINMSVNLGPGGARNRGVREATGELVAFLDSDDTWRPEHLEAAVTVLLKEGLTDCVVVHRPLGVGADPAPGETASGAAPRYREFSLLYYLLVQANSSVITVVAPRARMLETGGFPETRSHAEDFEFCIRLFARCRKRLRIEAPRTAEVGKHAYASGKGLSSAMWKMYFGSLRALRNGLARSVYTPLILPLWVWHTAKFVRRLIHMRATLDS